MWDLTDDRFYVRVGRFEMPWAVTYADTRPGHTDREKRERIREAAAMAFTGAPIEIKQWAFRVLVRKAGRRAFDIENVPKLIVDAFCMRQISADDSRYPYLALYEDDTIDHVVVLQVAGERVVEAESTVVEIFGRRPENPNSQSAG